MKHQKRKRLMPNKYGLGLPRTGINWLGPSSNNLIASTVSTRFGGVHNTNPFLVSFPRPFSSKKYPIQQNPFLIQPVKGKKNLRWTQALMNSKFPAKLNPLGDADKDGVLNMFDCRPFDKRRQESKTFKYKIKNKARYIQLQSTAEPKRRKTKKEKEKALITKWAKAKLIGEVKVRREAMQEAKAKLAAEELAKIEIKRYKKKIGMFQYLPETERERAMKTMEEATKAGQVRKARELAKDELAQPLRKKYAERKWETERKKFAAALAPELVREGMVEETLKKGARPTFRAYNLGKRYTKAEIARSKRMGGAPEALAAGVTKAVAVTAKALKPVYAAAEYAREVPLARLKERGHLAFERKDVKKGRIIASRIRGAMGGIMSLGGFEQLAEGGVQYTPGGEGSGRGRGRPRGSITPKWLPGVGWVQMPVFAYRKAYADIKNKAKMQAAMQQAAAEVAMARQQGRPVGQELMESIPESNQGSQGFQGSQGSQVGAGMEESSPSGEAGGMMEDNMDQMAADEAAMMRGPQQEQPGDLVAPPQIQSGQSTQSPMSSMPGTDRPFRQRQMADVQANPYGLKARYKINFGDNHVARVQRNNIANVQGNSMAGGKSSILNAPPTVTGERNPGWSKRRNMNQVFAGEGGAPDGII